MTVCMGGDLCVCVCLCDVFRKLGMVQDLCVLVDCMLNRCNRPVCAHVKCICV